jgi:uncharacterized protein (DUF1778 family)
MGRNAQVKMSVSLEDMELIKQRADQAGMSVSAYMYSLVLPERSPVVDRSQTGYPQPQGLTPEMKEDIAIECYKVTNEIQHWADGEHKRLDAVTTAQQAEIDRLKAQLSAIESRVTEFMVDNFS